MSTKAGALQGYMIFAVCAIAAAAMIGHWAYRRLAERKAKGRRRW
jgi:hypothetical protein